MAKGLQGQVELACPPVLRAIPPRLHSSLVARPSAAQVSFLLVCSTSCGHLM